MRRTAVFIFALALVLPAVRAAEPPRVSSADSAVLIDAATGTVLFEKNAGKRSLIASTTKIMTALLAIEHADPDDDVEVPDEAAGVEGSSMYLTAGQRVTVRDLLYGLMLKSGNDAAVALAVHCAGSVEAFAGMMNQKAQQLGMSGTHFTNPHGLNAERHYSTARDMAVLARAALQNAVFSHIAGSKYATVGGITIKNHNRMLWFYNGADGVKTGYTVDAGRCLVSSATRDGMRLIAVTLGAPDDWAEHTAMLDFGFENFTLLTVCERGGILDEIPVLGDGKVAVKTGHDVRLLLPKGSEGLTATETLVPRYLWGPVVEGQRVGMLTVRHGGEVKAQCPLLAAPQTEHF